MGDLTKKVLKHTTMVATAIGKATVKGTVWTAEQAWNHKEKIAGGVVGGAKGLYHFGQMFMDLLSTRRILPSYLLLCEHKAKNTCVLQMKSGKDFPSEK